jgi:thiaminase
MNKPLINKLAEQAKNSVTKDKHKVNEWIQNYNEQFVRLIVLECMRIINNNTVIELDEVHVSHNEACYENILTLEQRFGLDNDTST